MGLFDETKKLCIVGLAILVMTSLSSCARQTAIYPEPDPEIDKQLSALDDESIYVIELELYFTKHLFDLRESWTLPPTNGKCVQPVYCWYDDSITEEEYKAGVPARWFWLIQAAEPGKSELVFYHNVVDDETTEEFDEETTEYQDSQTFVFEVDENLHMSFVPEESNYEIEPSKGYHPRWP